MNRLAYLGSLSLLLGGCQLYFGERESPCDGLQLEALAARDPQTGLCEWPACGCDESGAVTCTADHELAGACYTGCDALDEKSCLATAGCQAVYQQIEVFDPNAVLLSFRECWATTGESVAGECAAQDAMGCAHRDDCRAIFDGLTGPGFHGCEDEGEPALPCPRVERLRNPETGACDPVCVGPEDDPSGGSCESRCTGLAEESCLVTGGCQAIYADGCPPSALCDAYVPRFAACWEKSLANPFAGECEDLDSDACSTRDDCAAEHDLGSYACTDSEDTTWEECTLEPGAFFRCRDEETPLAPCADTLDEASCIVNSACAPLYEGFDCTCDDTECTCVDRGFIECRDRDELRTCGAGGDAGCEASEYCDYPSDSCGWDDGGGVCKPRPTVCPDLSDCRMAPVCGCDGKQYANDCEAGAAGVDVATDHDFCRGV